MTPARGLTFGAAAEAYERYRLGYPDEIAQAVLSYADPPPRTALEIGAGTGKATRLFAARGIEVTAIEPDPAMVAVLRRQVPGAPVVEGTLETVARGAVRRERFDLVFAAAALHWTRQEGRWERVASWLEPHGVFASFGGPLRLADPSLAEAERIARGDDLPDDEVPSPDGTPADAPLQWPGTELRDSALFTDVRQLALERRITMSRHDYLGHLATVSAYLQLAPRVRERVLGRVEAALPGMVPLCGDLTLHLARRTPPS